MTSARCADDLQRLFEDCSTLSTASLNTSDKYAILPADPDPAVPASTSPTPASTVAPTVSDRTPAVVLVADTAADRDLQKFKFQIIIVGSTVGATMIIVTLIVAAIVYVCRHQKHHSPTLTSSMATPPPQPQQSSARTFIKYINKSGVLYFSTPADPNESSPGGVGCGQGGGGGLGQTDIDDQLTISRIETTPETKESGVAGTLLRHYVLPIATSTPETPQTPAGYKTRVYRWEDF